MTSSEDRVFLERTYELARRGEGSTAPNPPVGAVLVRDGKIIGEGFHHRAGSSHAEVEALHAADGARGATLYVSLEPCTHHGRTPPCTDALLSAGIRRVVIGTSDPSPAMPRHGAAVLRERGVEVTVAHDAQAKQLIAPFARSVTSKRPFAAVKVAASLDGYVTTRPNVREQLTGEAAQAFVRDLRIAYDAVAVGAHTVEVDDPQLTVRPQHPREREYVRVVFAQRSVPDRNSAVFRPQPQYARTILVVPAGYSAEFAGLEDRADVVGAGDRGAKTLDLTAALETLRTRGIASILFEAGPQLASALLQAHVVDRLYWLIAPVFVGGPDAVRAFPTAADIPALRFVHVEQLGEDVLIVADV